MPDLTTVGAVKQWLRIASTGDDALLSRLVPAVSRAIETYLGRPILIQLFNEVYDGNGGDRLVLPLLPGQMFGGIPTVNIDNRSIPFAQNPGNTGFRYSARGIALYGYRFTKGVRNVGVFYTAGFPTVPPDIEQAAIELVALRYRERDRIGQVSKSLNRARASFMQKDMPLDVAALLDQYTRVIA